MILKVHSMVTVEATALPEIRLTTLAGLKPMMLAENQKSIAGDNGRTAVDEDDPQKKPEPGAEADNKDASAKSDPAPLKPFKPSEEIAAEQAVDFPVDI
jgi:hypothetical protein